MHTKHTCHVQALYMASASLRLAYTCDHLVIKIWRHPCDRLVTSLRHWYKNPGRRLVPNSEGDGQQLVSDWSAIHPTDQRPVGIQSLTRHRLVGDRSVTWMEMSGWENYNVSIRVTPGWVSWWDLVECDGESLGECKFGVRVGNARNSPDVVMIWVARLTLRHVVLTLKYRTNWMHLASIGQGAAKFSKWSKNSNSNFTGSASESETICF